MKSSLAMGLSLVVLALPVGLAVVHVHTSPTTVDKPSRSRTATGAQQLWTCGMHPQVIQDHPGTCPICHMRLTPLRQGGATASLGGSPTVVIDPAVVQNMGIRTAEVTRGPLTKSVQTVGVLEAPETGLHDISPKVGGWIQKLYANQDGMHVHRGEPLFDLYSPDLMVAEQELIGAVKSERSLGSTADALLKESADRLVDSAKSKLRLLDVSDADIDAVASTLAAPAAVTFRSPASGAVIDKSIVEGSAVQSGQKLMRIEDHSTLWLQLQVYEDQMVLVAVGQAVDASVEAFPGQTFSGRITFIHPHLDPMSRTVMARAVLDNPDLSLRPGLYASATIQTQPVADTIQVPREAVIDTGTRQLVFVATSPGHFDPQPVQMGLSGDNGQVQIVSGLSVGETVVTSGQFLLDVESRTSEAIEKLRSSSAAQQTSSQASMSGLMQAAPPEPAVGMEMAAATAPALVPGTVNVAFCPMKKAHWLQSGSQVANPYFGTQMPDCGEVQRTLTAPEASSPLRPLLDAYLRVEAGLAADKLDANAVTALQTAAQGLSDGGAAELRSRALAVASGPDVAAARIALIPLSEALIRAINTAGPSTQPNQERP